MLQASAPSTRARPSVIRDWRATAPCAHFVQFYRADAELIEPLAEFVADGIWQGDRVIVIISAPHRSQLEIALNERKVDWQSSAVAKQFVVLDSTECLASFMIAGRPNRALFFQTVGEIVRQALKDGRKVRGFGEMVALLWAQGNRPAAIELEQLWNELGRECPFSLFCAYPVADVLRPGENFSMDHICNSHSAYIPAAC
jgi:hypothetical protein